MPSNNPLAGISIPSLTEMVDDAVERLGHRQIDLSNGLQRRALKEYLVREIDSAFKFELEQALHKASDKAITHIFRLMRDEDYQRKRAEASEKRKNERVKRAAERERSAKEERLATQKQKLLNGVVKQPMIQ